MFPDEITKDVVPALMATIRASGALAGQDIAFYKNLDKGLSDRADSISSQLLDITNSLLASVSKDVDELRDMDGVESEWNNIGGVLDILFEKTDIALDDLERGNKQTHEVKEMTTLAKEGDQFDVKKKLNIEKPQLKFKTKVDNGFDSPFKPLLTTKPHALKPLNLHTVQTANEDDILETHFEHPYEEEIKKQAFPDVGPVREPVMFADWNSTTAEFVDSKSKLDLMLDALKKCDVIAVDLEHHDYRSYVGFVCLMQISSRDQDWIVDTLILRDELVVLNEVFTDPKIVKVLHGSYMDIIWLQRDFGLYMVSLFDTYHAAKALELRKLGLAYLLETYAHFQTSKKYQLADWRVRPLPKEMLGYARADTHFLCYIYDVLRNSLIEHEKLSTVIEESKKVALQRYEKPGYLTGKAPGWKNLVVTYRLSPNQEVILEALFNWRDKVARDLDESPRYVMPNHFMIALCTQQPTTVQGVLSAANGITPHVRTEAREIANLILDGQRKIKALKIDTVEHDLYHNGSAAEEIGEWTDSAFDAYMASYQKSILAQKHVFDASSIRKTTERILKNDSDLFSGVLDSDGSEQPLTDDDELETRRMHVAENLQLDLAPELEGAEGENGEETEDIEEVEASENNNEESVSDHDEVSEAEAEEEKHDVLDVDDGDSLYLNSKAKRKVKRKQMALIDNNDKKRRKELTNLLSSNDSEISSGQQKSSKSKPSADVAPIDYSKAEPVLEKVNIRPPKGKKNTPRMGETKETIAKPKKKNKMQALRGQRTGTFKK